MSKIASELLDLYERNGAGVSLQDRALIRIADGVDRVIDLVKNSQEPASESLGDKKAKALMIVIQKMILLHKNQHRTFGSAFDLVEKDIFKLFEKAKTINRAENETEFQASIKDL